MILVNRLIQVVALICLLGFILSNKIVKEECLFDLLDKNKFHFKVTDQLKSFDYVRQNEPKSANSNDYILLADDLVEVDNSLKLSASLKSYTNEDQLILNEQESNQFKLDQILFKWNQESSPLLKLNQIEHALQMNLIHRSNLNDFVVIGFMFQLNDDDNAELNDFIEVIKSVRVETFKSHEYSFEKFYKSLKSSFSSYFFKRDYDLLSECDLIESRSVSVSWYVAKYPVKISQQQLNFIRYIYGVDVNENGSVRVRRSDETTPSDESGDGEVDDPESDESDPTLSADPDFIRFSIVMIVILSIIFAVIFLVLYICSKDLFMEIMGKLKTLFKKIFKSDSVADSSSTSTIKNLANNMKTTNEHELETGLKSPS